MSPRTAYISAEDAEKMMRAGDRNGLRELLNLAPGEECVDSDLLALCLEDVNSQIEVYVQGVVTTPMRDVPPMLRRIGLALLKAAIVEARMDRDSPEIQDAASRAVKQLADIRDGKLSLEFPQENRTERLFGPQTVTVGSNESTTARDDFRRVLEAY